MIVKHMIKLTMHVIQKISFENKNIPVMHNSRAKDVKNSNYNVDFLKLILLKYKWIG